MDLVMSRVGLNGKSCIPLLSSYACATPGIMATPLFRCAFFGKMLGRF
jgi:Fe2+ transport system protein B